MKKRVVFAYPYTAADGTKYKQEGVAEVDRGLAHQLINDGIARPAPASEPKSEPKGK